jgi:hypothetical protein
VTRWICIIINNKASDYQFWYLRTFLGIAILRMI